LAGETGEYRTGKGRYFQADRHDRYAASGGINHAFGFEGQSYEVFLFKQKEDAERLMKAFEGERFDYQDAESGKNWMKVIQGQGRASRKNRSA
jgi:hypothetical protein